MFYQSNRSNSSKYVTDTANFRNDSEYNSSKGVKSLKDDMFSSSRQMSIKMQQNLNSGTNSILVNTHTNGFFKNVNFFPSPNEKVLDSVKSTNRNQEPSGINHDNILQIDKVKIRKLGKCSFIVYVILQLQMVSRGNQESHVRLHPHEIPLNFIIRILNAILLKKKYLRTLSG